MKYPFVLDQLVIAEARRCVDTAFGRNRRRYGKDQCSRIMLAVGSVMSTIGHAKTGEDARDQLIEIFKIASKLHGIHQGAKYNAPEDS